MSPSRLRLPGYIQIEVTSRCNLSCSACPHGVRDLALEERHMPWEVFERLVASTFSAGQHYHLQGWGEPLLRSDLPHLARYIVDHGGIPSFTTNGTLVTPQAAEKLVECGFEFITVSLAGGRSDLQIEFKPGATLPTVLQALERLKQARDKRNLRQPRLAASFEITRRALPTLRAAVKLLTRAGAERIIAIHPILCLTADQEAGLLTGPLSDLDKKQAERDIRHAARAAWWRSISFFCEPLDPKIIPVCREDPLGSMFVGASGDISPCVFLGLPVEEPYPARHMGKKVRRAKLSMGNLLEADAADIWHSPRYAAFRKSYLARKAEAEAQGPLLSGDLEAPVPPACRLCLRSGGY